MTSREARVIGPKRVRAPFSMNCDQQVLTLAEWAALNGFGIKSARRLIKAGEGPTLTRLTSKRYGVTLGNNKKWQEQRSA
jgi:hypothetical protein